MALILIIGGRSKIGAALIGELLARGQQVRALARAGERAGAFPPEAETVTGDLADEGSLVTAMDGIDKVFLLSSPHPDAVGWHRNAFRAPFAETCPRPGAESLRSPRSPARGPTPAQGFVCAKRMFNTLSCGAQDGR
jgi:hypothetical protein